MKISHEIPKQLFPFHDNISDYPYCLAHLLIEGSEYYDKDYADFYKSKMKGASFSILDNSCLDYYSNILMADGTKIKLGKIVKKKLQLEVLSYNKKNKKIESKKIINWFDNGLKKIDWYKIIYRYSKLNRKNRVGLRCTGDHKVFTKDRGYIMARDLKINDKVCSDELTLNPYQEQLILGTLLGDGNIKKLSNTARPVVRTGHSDKQKNYLYFKYNILKPFARKITILSNNHPDGFNKREGAQLYLFETHPLMQLNKVQNILYAEGGLVKSYSSILQKLNWFGFCIWYLDDGSTNITNTCPAINISLSKISKKDRVNIPIVLKEKFDLDSKIKDYGNNVLLLFDKKNTEKIFLEIESFIPKCMNYKIHPKCFKNKKKINISNTPGDLFEVEVEEIINRGVIKKKKYDITIEGNHNYFADNVLVSNCYELGFPINNENLYQLGEEYKPTHIIVPDIYKKTKETIFAVEKYILKYNKISSPKFFAVIQGETDDELMNCYFYYLNNPDIDIIGVNFKIDRNQFLLKVIEKYGCLLKKIHLLGCQDVTEFVAMDFSLKKLIYSVDTSAPITHGWSGNRFSEKGCDQIKPKEKIAENLNIFLSDAQMKIINYNIEQFRKFVN